MESERKHDHDDVTILVVEDSPTQSERLMHLLAQAGYNVETAANGNEALTMVNARKPGMIIADIMMPVMDGYEFCRSIKAAERTKDLPVILLTALSEPKDIIEGLQCGANNFVVKPYVDEALLARVRSILLNQELRRENRSEMGIEIMFEGQKHLIKSDRLHMLDLLFCSYETAIRKQEELERTNTELRRALAMIEHLKGLIPICAHCKKIHTDDGYWQQVEDYVGKHSKADFTHTICPECTRKLYPDVSIEGE